MPKPAPAAVPGSTIYPLGSGEGQGQHPPPPSHRASGLVTSLGDRVPSCGATPYRRPLSCDFRLCSNRAASLKDTRRPVELVDRKRSVSASWPSGSSPLKSGSARRAERVGPRRAAPGAGRAAGWGGLGGGEGRGPTEGWDRAGGGVGTHTSAHTLTRSARACEHLRAGSKETEMSRNRAAPSLVGETDRHSRSGGPRGRAGGRADGQGAGLAGRRTLGWVSAIVQVGGGGLLCFLRGSGEGRQDSKVGRRAHLPGPDLTGPAPVQTHRAPQALRSRPPTPYRLTQRLLQAHARVRTCASWPALARSPGSRPARAAGRPRGGWAAHLLKRRWASQQRLHRSSTPDSTTSVPPTKSDMTTTSSTELSRMGSGSACGPARVRTAGVAAGGPPCPSPPTPSPSLTVGLPVALSHLEVRATVAAVLAAVAMMGVGCILKLGGGAWGGRACSDQLLCPLPLLAPREWE